MKKRRGDPAANRRGIGGALRWERPARDVDLLCGALRDEVGSLAYGGCELELLGIHAHASAPRTGIRPHRHSYYEAILVLDGMAREVTPPGQVLTRGTMQLHVPGEIHAWRGLGGPMFRVGVTFSVTPPVAGGVRTHWPRVPGVGREMRRLLEDVRSVEPGRRERLKARLVLLLAPALALLEWPEGLPAALVGETSVRSLAIRVEQFLSDNLVEPLTLADVAAQFNVSVPTLARRFRAEAGASVMNRLQDLRMRRAADLLRGREMSVKQVGVAVGIPEPSYFCRCFRRAFGNSPRSFGGASSDV